MYENDPARKRPKYKEMYLEQKALADFWAGRCIDYDKQLTQYRADAKELSRSRSSIRRDYAALHQMTSYFMDRVHHDILAAALEKNDWLYITALDPEAAQSFQRKFDEFSTYLSDKQPPVL